jgi:hypothetical protein
MISDAFAMFGLISRPAITATAACGGSKGSRCCALLVLVLPLAQQGLQVQQWRHM